MMETDVAWQGGIEIRERVHYGENYTQSWTVHGMDMNKQDYYPTYPDQTADRHDYYSNHTHALSGDVTSCHQSTYADTQIVPMTPMTSSHGMYDVHQHFPAGPASEMEQWHLQMLSQTDSFASLPFRDGPAKRKRRRVISLDQRKAANIRERRRMYELNDAFDGLRKRVPTFAYEKKLSRIETLNLAVNYIEFMAEILKNDGEKCKKLATNESSRDSKSERSLISDDDSLIGQENDANSRSHTPSQSANEDKSRDVSDNNDV